MNKKQKNNNYSGLGIGVAGGGLYGISRFLKNDVDRQIKESTSTLQKIKREIAEKEKKVGLVNKHIKKIKDRYGNEKTLDSLMYQDRDRLFNDTLLLPRAIEDKKVKMKELKKEITLKEKNSYEVLSRKLRLQEREREILVEEVRKIDKKIKEMDELKANVKKTMHDIIEEKKSVEGKMMSKSEYDNFKRRLDKKSKKNEFFHEVIKQNRASIKQRERIIRDIGDLDKEIKVLQEQINKMNFNDVKGVEIANLRSKYSALEGEQYALNKKLKESERDLKDLDKFLSDIRSELKDIGIVDSAALASYQESLNYIKNNDLPTWQNIVKKNNFKMKAADYIGKAGIGIGVIGASKFVYDKYKQKSSYK